MVSNSTQAPRPPKRGRPFKNPATTTVDAPTGTTGEVDARLHSVIDKGVGVIEAEMDVLVTPPISSDNLDRIVALTAKASEIRGQVVRADAHVTRRKLTLPQVEKAIAALTPDERATLAERFGGGEQGKSVLS